MTFSAQAQKMDWQTIGHPLDDDTKTMRDRYVYTDEAATDKRVGIDRPILSRPDVAEWLREHLAQIMTLEGARFDSQVATNRMIFTPSGYADYIVFMKNSGTDKFLKDNGFKMASFVEGNPEITAEGLRDIDQPDKNTEKKFLYVWQATARITVSYLDYRNQPPASIFKQTDPRKIDNRQPLEAKLELVRIPMQENGNLIAINRISFTAIAPPVKKAAESLDQPEFGR